MGSKFSWINIYWIPTGRSTWGRGKIISQKRKKKSHHSLEQRNCCYTVQMLSSSKEIGIYIWFPILSKVGKFNSQLLLK